MSKARSHRTPRAGSPRTGAESGYFWASTRPLHVLVFLVPLIVLYEVGSILYLSDPAHGTMETIGARNILFRFFNAFGSATIYLPGVVLVVVLAVWHLLERDRWRLYPKVLGGMALESVAWTLPLVVLGLLLSHSPAASVHPAMSLAQQTGPEALAQMSKLARLTLSIGAGLYEELLFRLILIVAVHFVLVDLGRVKERVAAIIAGLASAVAFTAYHDITLEDGSIHLRLAAFYLIAGLYFAMLFITRGFGIVVAVHAMYDVVALLGFQAASTSVGNGS